MINTWVQIELFLFESAQVRTLQRNNNTRISKREREKKKKEILQKNQCAKTHHITFISHATRDGLLELGVHNFQRNYVIQKKKKGVQKNGVNLD